MVLLLKRKTCLARTAASYIMLCIITEKQSNQINTLWWNKENGSWPTDSQSLRKPSWATVGPAMDKHQAPTNELKLYMYVRAVIESVVILVATLMS